MRYILPIDALDKICLLRQQFQISKNNINIDDKPPKIRLPTMFGGTDYETRKKQIVFLEKLYLILKPNLKRLDEITTLEQLPATITAWRVYLIACLYIQSQNSSGELNTLIDHDLGITAENFLDKEDKDNFYATADRFVNAPAALEEASKALLQAKQRPFTEQEWREFSEYIAKFNVKKESANTYTNYPITSITQPLFKATFSYTGATVGLLSGDVISKSTKAMSLKYQLTAFIGGSLLLFGPAGPTGVALIAPIVASKLITAFCSITLAHVLGVTMGIIGQGVGTIVGFPLDLACNLLWKVCTLIGDYYHKEPKQPVLTGMRLSDGATIICGVAISVTSEEEIAQHDKQQIIELKEDGSMYIDGKPIITPDNGVQLPPEAIEQLKEHLKIYAVELSKTPEAIQTDRTLELSSEQTADDNAPKEETVGACTI